MDFLDIAEGIRDRLGEGLDGFTERDIDYKGSFDIFNTPHDRAAVLHFGGLTQVRSDLGGGYFRTTRVNVTFGVPKTTEEQATEQSRELREHILDRIGTLPSLGVTDENDEPLFNAEVIEVTDVPEVAEWGGNVWWFENAVIEVTESVVFIEED